jgi:hypothetical protein
LVARLNQHRDYRAWTELVGPGVPSAAELKNVKKHSIQNLRHWCAEFGIDSDGSRYEVITRLNQHRDWHNRCAQILQTQQKMQTASADKILACNPSWPLVSNAMKILDGAPHDVWQPQSATCPNAVWCDN